VSGPVIVAVHVNGNATVGVIESVRPRSRGRSCASARPRSRGRTRSRSRLRPRGWRVWRGALRARARGA